MAKKRLLVPMQGKDRIVKVRLGKVHEVITTVLAEKSNRGEIHIPNTKGLWDLANDITQEIDKNSTTIVDIDLT